MNRKEPYIGMPIVFDDLDDFNDFDDFDDSHDDSVPCCGKMDAHHDYMSQQENTHQKQSMHEQENAHQQNMHQHQNMQPMALAMAYVPWQKWTEVYPLDEGLNKGTIFPDLYLPFEEKRKRGMHR